MNEWAPVLQTILGAAIALAAVEWTARRQRHEADRAERRATYIEMLRELDHARLQFGEFAPKRSDEENFRLMVEAQRSISAFDLVGSEEVRAASAAVNEAITEEINKVAADQIGKDDDVGATAIFYAYADAIKRHRERLLEAMRKDLER